MYEEVEIKSTRSRQNIYNVPVKAWKKWTPLGRQAFNEVYSAMANNRDLFLHPHQEKISRRFWKTTSWNAAWIAADSVS